MDKRVAKALLMLIDGGDNYAVVCVTDISGFGTNELLQHITEMCIDYFGEPFEEDEELFEETMRNLANGECDEYRCASFSWEDTTLIISR